MGSNSQREFIDHIRREKFGIGTTKCNPLAKMLHQAIAHLSVEMYQKDIHFISELLQNAEDNVYGTGVSPSLEMVLTRHDIARVGAEASLILFNNEVGFQPAHVEALCAVGLSTKKGKRDSGYIGEKGIGFKSVFLVTRTPYIISNGYRFRFTDEPSNEAKIGYVVPEWTDIPTDADLRLVYGKAKLPQTMIILPLRPEKIEPVREQLKQVSPETLLFLSKLRQLVIRNESQSSLCISRSDTSMATDEYKSKLANVNLSVGSNAQHVSEKCNYQLLQQRFRVTHPVEQRKEVENWDISIAFPLLERINPGRSTGDIYAFLPSYLASGFPFVINADFLLVSSRETLKFDSPWNIGILECVPTVFLSAFKLFLQTSSSSLGKSSVPAVAIRDAYRYIPTKKPQNAELWKVQKLVLDLLRHEDCVLIDSLVGYIPKPQFGASGGARSVFCKPEMARLIKPEFRNILVAANAKSTVNPAIRNMGWYVVDRYVQETYSSTLQSIGVTEMTEGEYVECLTQEHWLLSLSEELYWEVVCFVLDDCRYSSYTSMHSVPILKYCKEDGSVGLASAEEARSANGGKIYLSPLEKGEWLSKWTSLFKPWVSVLFMPTKTVRVLKTLKQKSSSKIISGVWDYLISVVPDLSVEQYLLQLLQLLSTTVDPKFVILTTDFAFQCVQGKDVEKKDVYRNYPSDVPIVNQSGKISYVRKDIYNNTKILLPARGSSWPQLSLNSWSSQIVIMSDDYVRTPSAWPSSWKVHISAKDDGLDLETYRSYLRSIVGAVDIPDIIPPDDAVYSIPNHLSSNMTIEQAGLLLQWITSFLKSRSAYGRSTSCFLRSLKETPWLPTEAHGRRRPSSCLEKSAFGAFFKYSDVPFVGPYLSAFRSTLADLGVVIDIDRGCDAVVNHMLEISKDTAQTNSCDLKQATRWYTYLQKFKWNPATNSGTLKIFVPVTAWNRSNTWLDRDCCVLYRDDGFFDKLLTALEDVYPRSLLSFFGCALIVPSHATVERYCELWLKWRSDVHEITADECTRVWKVLSEKRKNCDAEVWKEFVKKAWVPSKSEATGAFQLLSPSTCFIPDDLYLHSLFSSNPSVQLVWYPDRTEKMECAMNAVYVELGVKKLSECVEAEFIIGDVPDRNSVLGNERFAAASGDNILCPGLYRAILGFIARKKYGLSSSSRQSVLASLQGVVQTTISRPLSRSYRISNIAPPATVTEEAVMALWSKTDGKLYCLDSNNSILQNSVARRDFHVQLATTISLGLLSEHPLIVDDLTEFLIGLLPSGFESSHVEFELRRKNAKLYEEDELFLSQL